MRVNFHIPDMPEAEALKLSEGITSERIKAVARKAIIAARDEAKRTGRISFTEIDGGAWEVRDGIEIVGIAHHYKTYWQIYLRKAGQNIRRTTWPLLKAAIEERLTDAS